MYSRKEHIKKSVRIPSTTHRPDKKNIQPVGMQSAKGKNILNKRQTNNLQSDNNRFNIKENPFNHTGHTEPNEKSMMDLLCNIMNRLEIIETAAKKTVPYLQVKKTVKAKRQKTAIAKAAIALGKLIREVKWNRISAKCLPVEVNKFSHSREDLEGWLTEAYTWHKALEGKLTTESERVKSAEIKSFVQRRVEMIVSEQKKMLTSLLERPFNKVSLDHLLVKENNQISLATEPEEWDEVYSPSVRIEEYCYDALSEPIMIEKWNQNIWQYQDVKLDERVWYSNITINTIEQYKNLDLTFDMVERSWHLQENGPTIISMLDSKLEKQSKQPRKVSLWFQKLEELLIDDAESHKVKEDFLSNDINISALQPHCRNVISDNRCKQVTKILGKSALIEHWTEMHIQGDKYSLLKCEGCNFNTKGKENRYMISCNKNLIR
ncbi:44770_t:CDS:2, partial [Gigaspora margarita]